MQPESHDYTFRNWSGALVSTPERLYLPRSTDEVVEIVREAHQLEAKLRLVGSGHSFSAAACPEASAWLISLERMNRVLEVDRVGRRVRVEAGIRLRDLNELLDRHGLALSNLGSISEQTLAGATATGTHGTGAAFGILSTQIAALQLVLADGTVRELGADDGDDFRAAALSLGALGVVTELVLDVVPAFRLEEANWTEEFETALARLPAALADHEHLRLYYFPYVRRLKVFHFNRTVAPVRRRGPLLTWFHDRLLYFYTMRLLFVLGAAFPEQVPRLNRFASWVAFRRERFVDRSDRIFNTPMPPPHVEMEYAIPIARAAEALRALRALIEGGGMPVNYAVEVRFARADDLLLSPAHGRDVCYLGAYAQGRFVTDEYFPAFHQLMRDFEGMPHLGKIELFEPGELPKLLPGAARFEAVRRRLDPTGVFLSPFAAHVLTR